MRVTSKANQTTFEDESRLHMTISLSAEYGHAVWK